MAQTARRSYKHSAPFDSGFLSVGEIHRIHYDKYGNKDGKPARLWPVSSLGEIRENSSPHLVSDIDALRKHFGVRRWHVFSASWSTTVALLYAQTHPEAVVSVTLRGVSYFEPQEEMDFNAAFQRTYLFRPELYDELVGLLTEEDRKDVADSYAKRILGGDPAVQLAAAKVYDRWAGGMSKLVPKEDDGDAAVTEAEEKRMIASIRIEWHYHAHNLLLKDMQFLVPEKLEKIKNIPFAIVNGRYDLICPPVAAWGLHKVLPKSKLFIIPDAGHSANELGIQHKLVDICDEFVTLPI